MFGKHAVIQVKLWCGAEHLRVTSMVKVSCGHVRRSPRRGVREKREQVRHGTGRKPSKPPVSVMSHDRTVPVSTTIA